MVGKFDEYKTALPQILEDSRTKLTEKKVEVPTDFKLDDLPGLIAKVETGSKVEIVVTAPDYERETLTCKKDQTELTATVNSGECRFEVKEEGTWTVSATDGKSVEVEVKFKFEGELEPHGIYGVTINESESNPTTRVDYIDDAKNKIPVQVNLETGEVNFFNWKQTWILRNIYPVMLKSSGEIDYRLDPNDQTKKINGELSDISNIDYDGNAMVCIERFYTKFSMDGVNEVIQVSDLPKEGFEPIGFVREDDSVADRIFLPMFFASFSSNDVMRSLSEQEIKFKLTFNTARTAAHKNGDNYDIESYTMNQILEVLFLILFKSCDWRNILTKGRVYDLKSPLKTGILANKGCIALDPSTGTNKFLWIEDFFSQCGRYEIGFLSKQAEGYVRMKPPYSIDSVSGYLTLVTANSSINGYINRMKCDNTYGRIANYSGGSETTYETSYWHNASSYETSILISGRGGNCGLSGRNAMVKNVDVTANPSHSAALTYLPPAEVVYE